jgi:hypothetical protein
VNKQIAFEKLKNYALNVIVNNNQTPTPNIKPTNHLVNSKKFTFHLTTADLPFFEGFSHQTKFETTMSLPYESVRTTVFALCIL